MTGNDDKVGAKPREITKTQSVLFLSWCISVVGLLALAPALLDAENRNKTTDSSMADLIATGREHIENRRWSDAENTFGQIENLHPASALAALGRKKISEGREEEETQFLGYWTGQALAEFDAGNLDLAESAIQKLLVRRPDHREATELKARIADARVEKLIQIEIGKIRSLLTKEEWDQAITKSKELATKHPAHSDVLLVKQQAVDGKKLHLANLAKARELYAKARDRDQGKFDQQALDWLSEAALLSPDDQEILALLHRMSAYTRTIRVPEDISTPAEAIAQSRVNDRIVIGKGTWNGPLVIKQPLKLEGAGPKETIISCRAETGNVITVAASGVMISGCTIRHENLTSDKEDRHSTLVVANGSCDVLNCHITQSNGHGIAVLKEATATVRRCQLTGNAWNGAAAQGPGSSLSVQDSLLSGNFQNGIESWREATAEILRCQIRYNSRNGIHIDQNQQDITCKENTISENREYAICLTSAGKGRIEENQSTKNLLGGILVRHSSGQVTVASNHSKSNVGADLILEAGLDPENYRSNQLTPSRRDALLAGAKFGK